ncbi:MAG: shikimate kinase [Salibacteraceae bacterium]
MGSGKTTVGRKLANLLGWSFFDTDTQVEQLAGKSIIRIFQEDGEEAFRQREMEALVKLARNRDAVIATGGGLPTIDAACEFMLNSGFCIWMKASPGLLAERLTKGGGTSVRPLLTGLEGEQLENRLKTMCTERAHWYERAHLHIDALNVKSANNMRELTRFIQAQFRAPSHPA